MGGRHGRGVDRYKLIRSRLVSYKVGRHSRQAGSLDLESRYNNFNHRGIVIMTTEDKKEIIELFGVLIDEKVMPRFDEQDKKIEVRFQQQDAKFDAKFAEQDRRIDLKFEQSEKKMITLMGDLMEEMIIPRFDKLEEDISVLKEDVSNLRITVKSIDNRLINVEEKVDRIDRRSSENEDAFADDILKLYDQDKWAKREILKLKAASS